MTKIWTAAVAGALLVAGCASAPRAVERDRDDSDTQPAPAPATNRVLPANTYLEVELDSTLDARTSRIGDRFTARVTEPLEAQDGSTVVAEGAVLTGLITGVLLPADGEGQAAIRLNFVRIQIEDAIHPFSAAIVDTEFAPAQVAPDSTASADPAPLGAVLGEIVGGELRDVLILAELGAGAGSIVSLGTGALSPVLPAGTGMTIRSLDGIEIRRE